MEFLVNFVLKHLYFKDSYPFYFHLSQSLKFLNYIVRQTIETEFLYNEYFGQNNFIINLTL